MTEDKFYDGSIYVAVTGAETTNTQAFASIQNIQLREGDSERVFAMSTKGYEARQQHLDNFLDSKHDFILFLDADQVYPMDTAERLRSHGKPFVSCLYMRRNAERIIPVWCKPYDGKYPLEIWADPIERGKLHLLGASGWGGVLVHRNVVLGVRSLLQGEWEILEDDMDIWPYDLEKVMGAIRALRCAVDECGILSTHDRWIMIEDATVTLETEIRPLLYAKEPTGSDVRFAFYAMLAGYPLYGDPDCRAGHIVNYSLTPDDFDRSWPAVGELRRKNVLAAVDQERLEYLAERARING